MSEIAKLYEPKNVEEKWYNAWIQAKCFSAEADPKGETYCVMMPPPNVTGVLTMGHVLNNTVQDILVRCAHQQGKSVLWLPGTDHAGIATQTKVEKELRKEGKTRYNLGQDQFIEGVKAWRDKHGGKIFGQLKRLGSSCDWDRSVHTLDEKYSRAVLKAFVILYERGYIYRGKRMVNWCPVSLTALSDEEVIMKPRQSILYTVRYETVENPGEYLEISTTRPETIMGDSAVAVNPKDERYNHLIGKHVYRPFPKEGIPIIGDEAVEIKFGTGVLKVTPAHDLVDFEIGQRHNVAVIDLFNENGTMNESAGAEFEGMDRFEARKKAVQKLEQMGSLVKREPYQNNIGYSERADVPIEPRLSEQWFLKYPKVEEAKEVVKSGIIKFWPQRWEKTYLHWLDNIQDWCISRQLWWGHRIPVWYKKGGDRTDPKNWHVSLGGPSDPENWEQDEDVLDTWASSWIWPFATLGWPDEKAMEERGVSHYYPTSNLVTGPDIIFFWVARMIVAGLEFMGEEKKALSEEDLELRKPFSNVYFTGIIRDLQGRKMSKSLGNSPDPSELIEKYGADGLRFGIISIAPQGQDVIFSEERVQQGRNFCNKLWNACRFRQMAGGVEDNVSVDVIARRMNASVFDADDHAILERLVQTLEGVTQALKAYEFNGALQLIYGFFWNDFCDWYVEVSKSKLQDERLKATCLAIQDLVIRQVLLMLHPFTPFITEELWHELRYGQEGSFIQNVAPGNGGELREVLKREAITVSQAAVQEIANVREFVSLARSLKAEYNLAAKKDLTFYYASENVSEVFIETHRDKIKRLIGAKSLSKRMDIRTAPAVVTPLGTLYIDLEGSVDIETEKVRLQQELDSIVRHIKASSNRLQNESFLAKAPDNVIEKARERLTSLHSKHEELSRLLKGLDK